MIKTYEVVIPEELVDLEETLKEFIPGNYYTSHVKRLQAAEVLRCATIVRKDPITDYDIKKLTSANKAVRDWGMRLGVSLGKFKEIQHKGKTAWRRF